MAPGSKADELRTTLVEELVADGWISSARVQRAMSTVPRHLFVPAVPVEQAYANDAVVTKRDARGAAMSSVSAPNVVALMLEQAELREGHRVLEVGSGGYNAALLSELVGEAGQVTTIDIDPEVTDRAQRSLSSTGYPAVRVRCADGEYGAEEDAPFDGIIVTAGAWDIPPAWRRQLAPGGRLVVPLRMLGLSRSVVFERDDRTADRLVSRSYEPCGFVPMQGASECPEREVSLHGDEVVLLIDNDAVLDVDALSVALSTPRTEVWSGVTVGQRQRLDGLEFWLARTFSGARIVVQPTAIDSGVVAPAFGWGARAIVDGDSLAYLALRKVAGADANGDTRHELGAYGHGSRAAHLAEQLAEQIRGWDGEHGTARIEVHPAQTPDAQLPPARVIDKRHTRATISWP